MTSEGLFQLKACCDSTILWQAETRKHNIFF